MPSLSVASTKCPGFADSWGGEAAGFGTPSVSKGASSKIKMRQTCWGRLTMRQKNDFSLV